jgi:SAM-dependent methyltransferase
MRIKPDDAEYAAQAAAEAAFWKDVHPFSLESLERFAPASTDLYSNERFTGERHTRWDETICRYGEFKRGLVLGTSQLTPEARILETNRNLHLTFVDISEGALNRRTETLGPRFPGRVDTQLADLNFATFERSTYDVIISAGCLHHVFNLEFCAAQVNNALTDDGYFFLQDYVGEKRSEYSDTKKRVYEMLVARDLQRRGQQSGVRWHDQSDLSPFCGVTSDEVLPVFGRYLETVSVRTAAALVVCMMHSNLESPPTLRTDLRARARRYLRRRIRNALRMKNTLPGISAAFLADLALVGDTLAEAGIILPGTAFGVYRKHKP